MLALRTNADFSLLNIIWTASILFFAVSVFLCVWMTVRRIHRNRARITNEKQEHDLRAYFAQIVNTRPSPQEAVDHMPPCSASVLSKVLLHYFRTLKGSGFVYVQTLVCETNLERIVARATNYGISGRRARALKVLSYLPSKRSRPVIYKRLSSRNKYVRITAARGLVRRNALDCLDAIIESVSTAFPNNIALLATIIKDFGADVVEPLERRVLRGESDMIRAACLEALVMLMPARTSLDLTYLATHPDNRVRAAALSLSAVSLHAGDTDPISASLRDPSVKVKIRAAKIACDSKRKDITSELFGLADDPVMWVRYWALKAIWRSGRTGRKFVTSLTETNQTAARLVKELQSGYV